MNPQIVRCLSDILFVTLLMTHRQRLTLLAAVLMSFAAPNDLKGQNIDGVSESLLREVMSEADLFSPATGDPLVKQAYRGQELIGYVFSPPLICLPRSTGIAVRSRH
ncbi:MAG: hypothetical protein CM1200mP14_12650 [Gammaproteobacteria bacterium]|nr:MAG: hypothetical protein CM1200mP14_12650 [Gammaproteobacteria bacterium]